MPRTPKKSKSSDRDHAAPGRAEAAPNREDEGSWLPGAESGAARPEAADAVPMLPIRNEVYFPHMMFPLLVGREKSVRAVEEASGKNRRMVIVAQKNVGAEDPGPDDLYAIGIIAEIIQVLRMPDGTMRVMLEGIERCRILRFAQSEPFYRVDIQPLPTLETRDLATEALMRSVITQFEHIAAVSKSIQPEAMINVVNTEEPGRLADVITPYLRQMRVESQQEILETLNACERLHQLAIFMKKEADILELQKNIRSRVEKEMGDTQREFFLREQLKVIQQELGEQDDDASEIETYRRKIAAANMPDQAAERALREVARLERMPLVAPEGSIIRNYLDWLTILPWNVTTKDSIDLIEARRVLDEDHFGLEKVKERILEFLAVRKLTGSVRGPILCFVGPPGVGKTSIGRSIARAIGRKFVRISLGGVRDEAEIRGHRRTYIGAMPGRIIQGIRQAGARNPVFILDEVDKLSMDFRGDPSSALLEALDPEQNREFSDHYIETPFDLSDVMFVTTANLLDPIPAALRDRMEVIPFASYTEHEKLAISRQFLTPRQIRDHGIDSDLFSIQQDGMLKLIREYTREAGVRNLDREIAGLCRKVARSIATGDAGKVDVTAYNLPEILGKRRFHYGVIEEKNEIGAATGLVYTEAGGDIISVEVSLLASHEGRIQLTGKLGDVMKESAQAAFSFVRSRTEQLGIPADFYRTTDIHVHVPSGGIPKDGPSAGITIATALASALTRRPVRNDVAMTGEITLRGRVLPVGGVKEKLLAAHRAGIRLAVIPLENEKDIEELPENVRQEMCFEMVTHMDRVLELALIKEDDSSEDRPDIVKKG